RTEKRSVRLVAVSPPGEQAPFGFFLAERSFIKPELEQPLVGLTDLATRRNSEDTLDSVAVEVRANRFHLLTLTKLGDSRLEVVVGEPEAVGLAAVAGGDVCPRENV